ncbi:MAG: Transcriptional regulatory protein ZraR [Deltaproteobacteria bacterium ADurb.Bin151]|jgi:two-component system response regulator PilR (NtrC family)|nr:sigma-54-dependent Fis family transcriptional regulator [Smithella sp.]OQB56236.1 MAG: Transcriptional regulatory protein ZraR [Deltaproteobacteria bacterium ADurb.Bin151]HNZ10116.1 sigma-54 dependent transcriptional regulator [Smithellaceae bacterium]HOG80900.1 sigma-54 dependent transcriptional regulator [Smithellaceae bacterium]HPL65195.1 sigma-54 dependent transcriptional regulator [Smithellaceae bacterium]
MAKILVLDDQDYRFVVEEVLKREGYEVTTADNPQKAINLFRKTNYDLVITDLKMPKMDGIEFLKTIKDHRPETVVILITAYASGETAVNAMQEGAFDYVEKGGSIEELKQIVRQALLKNGLVSESQTPTQEGQEGFFCGMIGTSREMGKVFATIKKVANTPANILILGESGTGKELVARAIHANSSRSKMPFMAINSGGIPENLLESELFGYMKGSFTGAYADRAGLFELAKGGTVFLDEIGELPPVLQVKLLRVVQEKTFRRIGGSEDIRVDVRIISATNQNLQERVRKGDFREDLYFRLNVIPIHMPPLRKRKEDIPLLTRHFIEKYAAEFGKEVRMISSYAMELLMEYPFPGNIRELENIIERGVAMETSNIILPENLVLLAEEDAEQKQIDLNIPDSGIDLNAELEKIEKRAIQKVLQKTNGSKTKAAEMLHVTFDSLRYRIEKLGVE